MRTLLPILPVAFAIALHASSCASSRSNTPDKKTDWLGSCDEDRTCREGLVCVKGLCTAPCVNRDGCLTISKDAICAEIMPRASCADAASAPRVERACTLACERTSECTAINEALLCAESSCVADPCKTAAVGEAGILDAALGQDAAPEGGDRISLDAAPDANPADADAADAPAADAQPEPSIDGLRDEDLGDPSAWSIRLGVLDADYFGEGDGIVHFDRLGLCGRSAIGQTYDLAAARHPDPMVFAIEYFAEDPDECFAPIALVLDGIVQQPIAMPSQNGVARVCLGERAYGSDIDLELRAMSTIFCPTMTQCQPRSLGSIALRPAQPAECAQVGTFANPDFSDDLAGWSFDFDQEPRLGDDGELILERHMCGSLAFAKSNVSIPTSATLPNAAIRFDVRFEPGPEPELLMRGPAVTLGFGAHERHFERQAEVQLSQTTTVTTCLPSFAAGTSQTVFFEGFDPASGCRVDNPVLLYTMSLSNIELISDPECAADAPELAIDGVANEKSAWYFHVIRAGLPDANEGMVGIVTDEANARSGSQVLKLDAASGCAWLTAFTRANIPVPAAGSKLALSFWHRLDSTDDGYIARTLPFGGLDREIDSGPEWQREEYCIDETHYGHLMPMSWELLTTGGATCDVTHAPVTLWIDDVELRQSEACP